MEFFGELILEFFGNIIMSVSYYLLQGMGAVVRWLAFVGDRKPEYLIKQKELNAFIGVLVLASGVGFAYVINNY